MTSTGSLPPLPPDTLLDLRWRVAEAPDWTGHAWLAAGRAVDDNRPVAILLWPIPADLPGALRRLQQLSRVTHPRLAPLQGWGCHRGHPFAIVDAPPPLLPWSAIDDVPLDRHVDWLFTYLDVASFLQERGLLPPPTAAAGLRLAGDVLQILPLGPLDDSGPPPTAGAARLARELFTSPPDKAPDWWPVVAGIQADHFPLSTALKRLAQTCRRRATPPPLLPPLLPLIGRRQQLADLAAALDRVLLEEGGAFLIGGTSGSGKGRLVDETILLALSRGVTVRRLTPAPFHYVARSWPDLLQLLHVEPPPATDAAPERAARLLAAVFQQLRVGIDRLTAQQPLLLIIEAAHQLPPEVGRLLEHLLPIIDGLPLLLLITYRDDLQPTLQRRLRRARHLRLTSLDLPAIDELLQAARSNSDARQATATTILQRTGGNPLLIGELLLTSAAIDGGGLDRALMLLSGGVGTLVGHRLLRLQPAERRLLQTAALLGMRLEPGLLAAQAPEIELETWLAAATQLGVVQFVDGGWQFTHPLVAAETAATIGLSDRPVRHAALAALLETETAAAPERLAGHWLDAGEALHGATYASLAGDQAVARGMLSQARRHYERSADALSTAADQSRQRELVEVISRLAHVAALQREDDQSHRLGHALIVAPTLGDPRLEARLYAAVGTYQHAHGRLPQAINYLTRCLIVSETHGLDEVACGPLNLLGQTFCAVGKLEAGLPYLERGAAAANAAGFHETASRSLAYSAVAHWFRGQPAAAAEAAAEALAQAATAGSTTTSDVEAILGYGLAFAGRHDAALPLLESAITRPQLRRDSVLHMLAHGVLGGIALAHDQQDRAALHLNRALEIAGRNRTATLHLPVIQALRSLIALSSGNYPAAVRGVEEALDLAEVTQQPLAQAICQQILCRILLEAPNPDWTTGEYLLLESMTYYRQEGAAPFVAATTADLGLVYYAQGHVALAETTLTDALAQMEALGMNWDAARVRSQLEEIQGSE